MLIAADFRARFPHFADAVKWPDASIDFYVTLAAKSLPPERWLDLLPEGTALFVAHNLALDAMAAGKIPGRLSNAGIVASKSVGPAAISYDNHLFMLQNAGHWGMTIFGIRFLQLARMVGAGGYQL